MSTGPTTTPSPAADEPSKPQAADRPRPVGHLVHKREFVELLGQIDSVMRSSEEPLRRKPQLSRAAKLVIAAVLILALAVGKDRLLSWWLNYGPIPEELVGAWETRSDRFEGRGFVITMDSLQLRLGGGESVTYPIVGMRRGRGADRNLFTLDYRDEAAVDLELALYMKSDSVIHIANLPGIVWTKERLLRKE
jgi:hypothetical protein